MAVQAEHSNFSREIVDDLAGNVKQCRNPGTADQLNRLEIHHEFQRPFLKTRLYELLELSAADLFEVPRECDMDDIPIFSVGERELIVHSVYFFPSIELILPPLPPVCKPFLGIDQIPFDFFPERTVLSIALRQD